MDYLGVSPVFSTPTKTDIIYILGNRRIWKTCVWVTKHKLIAIGGINQSNAEKVIQAGADGIAVVSAICSAKTPKQLHRNYYIVQGKQLIKLKN